MNPSDTSFDRHTDAAIEQLVDMYLSRQTGDENQPADDTPQAADDQQPRVDGIDAVEMSNAHIDQQIAQAIRVNQPAVPPPPPPPAQSQFQPAPTPAPPAARQLTPGHVELVLVGHLPGLANPWVSQYADFRAAPGRPVAICHMFGEQVEIDVVHRDADPPRVSADCLDDALEQLAGQVGLWLIRTGEPDTTQARSASAVAGTWTLLSGADEAAVVAAYQLVKRTRLPLADAQFGKRRVQLMLAGCGETEAAAAAEKITRASAGFLKLPCQWLGLRSRMNPVAKQRIGIYPNSTQPGAEPNWAHLLRFMTDRLAASVPTDPAVHITLDDAARPTLRLHTDEPDDLLDAHGETLSDTPDDYGPAADPPGPTQRPVDILQPHMVNDDDVDESAGAWSLIDYVEDLQPLPVRCPLNEQAELAVDAAGAMHVLYRADGDAVHRGVTALMIVQRWAAQHAAMLHQCCDLPTLNTAHIALHLFTNTPKPVIQLALAGDVLGQPIKLHLLHTVGKGEAAQTVHVELN